MTDESKRAPSTPPPAVLERVANHGLLIAQAISKLTGALKQQDRADAERHRLVMQILTDIKAQSAIAVRLIEGMQRELTPPAGTQLGPDELEVSVRGRSSFGSLARLMWRLRWLWVGASATLAGWKAYVSGWLHHLFP